MTCKVEAVLKRTTAEERRKGSSRYQQCITDVTFEGEEGSGGGFSSVVVLFQNYLESQKE